MFSQFSLPFHHHTHWKCLLNFSFISQCLKKIKNSFQFQIFWTEHLKFTNTTIPPPTNFWVETFCETISVVFDSCFRYFLAYTEFLYRKKKVFRKTESHTDSTFLGCKLVNDSRETAWLGITHKFNFEVEIRWNFYAIDNLLLTPSSRTIHHRQAKVSRSTTLKLSDHTHDSRLLKFKEF